MEASSSRAPGVGSDSAFTATVAWAGFREQDSGVPVGAFDCSRCPVLPIADGQPKPGPASRRPCWPCARTACRRFLATRIRWQPRRRARSAAATAVWRLSARTAQTRKFPIGGEHVNRFFSGHFSAESMPWIPRVDAEWDLDSEPCQEQLRDERTGTSRSPNGTNRQPPDGVQNHH